MKLTSLIFLSMPFDLPYSLGNTSLILHTSQQSCRINLYTVIRLQNNYNSSILTRFCPTYKIVPDNHQIAIELAKLQARKLKYRYTTEFYASAHMYIYRNINKQKIVITTLFCILLIIII